MIDFSELRPNNVLLCHFNNRKISRRQVKELKEHEFELCKFIPLEDALLDYGFKKNGFNFYCERNGYLCQWSNNANLKYLLKIRHIEKDDMLHLHNVRYLHELQNIYKIFTGVEL